MLLVADIVCHQLWAPVVQRAGWGTDGHELTHKVLGLQVGDGEEGCVLHGLERNPESSIQTAQEA